MSITALRKDHPLIECLGTLDELDAFLAQSEIAFKTGGNECFTGIIGEVRKELSSKVMPLIAQVPGLFGPDRKPAEIYPDTKRLEQWITELKKENPVSGFVHTWTNPVSAVLNIARTVCRRCERRMVSALAAETVEVENSGGALLTWINRLSDLLFYLAVS